MGVYSEKIRQLEKRYAKNTGGKTAADNKAFALWVVENIRPTQSPSSWKIIRGAFRATFAGDQAVLDAINVPPLKKREDMPKKTSNHRQKYITNNQLVRINQHLNENAFKIKWAMETYLFLNATVFTGFRPSEWRASEITENQAMSPVSIKTINLKQVAANNYITASSKKQRKSKPYRSPISASVLATEFSRSISIDHLDDDKKDIIIRHCSNVQMLNELDWKAFYKSVVYTLARTHKKIHPNAEKAINLYSARHQFAANQKKHLSEAGFSKHETKILVASLMGHASRQSQLFYAGKRKGDASGNYALPVSGRTIDLLKRIER